MQRLRLIPILCSALLLPMLIGCSGGESPAPAVATVDMPPAAWTDDAIDSYKKGKEGKGAKMLIEIFEEGPGEVVEEYDRVMVHYQGWVTGSKGMFDTSFKRGKPIEFAVGTKGVIGGWDLGIEGMTVGTRARLHIPPTLGYGERGNPPMIPRNAPLIFDIQVVSKR